MGLEDRQYYRDDQGTYSNFSFSGRSIVTTIIILNLVIFAIDAFTPKLVPGDAQSDHWLTYLLSIKYAYPWHVWNYLTYGFAHASYDSQISFWHVGGNMLTLFFLGRSVEHALGRWEFLRFYLISIVVCGIGFTIPKLLFGWEFSFLVGASGGVSAVVGLFIFMFPKQTLLLMGVLPMPAWVLGVLLLLQNFFAALSPQSHTAWEAHLIGLAIGAAYFYGRWDFSSLSLGKISNPLKSRPKLRVHNPGPLDDKLKEQADLILQKISEQGEASLSSRERKTLNKYSQQLRKSRH